METQRKKKKKKQHTGTRRKAAYKRHGGKRRARRSRNLIIGCAAAALILLIIVTGVIFARGSRARQAAADAADTRTTDVMDAPFSGMAQEPDAVLQTQTDSAVTADGAVGGMAQTGGMSDGNVVAGGISGSGLAEGTDAENAASGESTGNIPRAHVSGIGAFSLYVYDEARGIREKTSVYESAWTRGTDIVSFESFASDEASIALAAGGGGAWYEAWRAYWYADPEAEHCRIGYHVAFSLKSGEEISATLMKPGDELFYRDYLENYLYDDAANAYAGWYSHLEPGGFDSETLMTSIKFTPGERFDEIDGKITVTGFVYDTETDFDADGNYIGDVSFTAEIRKR